MKFSLFIGILSISICSCLYKAGNRQPDINYTYRSSISPYYVKAYMRTLDSSYANRGTVTSEIVNYPENFIPVTDSSLGLKYVIEFHSLDSLSYRESNYFDLASIYDFKKAKWITDRDSLQNDELEKFQRFFEGSVLTKVVNRYMGKVPDSLLFVEGKNIVKIQPLD